MSQFPNDNWLENAENELRELFERIEYLDNQGRIDPTLNAKASELQKAIDNFKRLFNE